MKGKMYYLVYCLSIFTSKGRDPIGNAVSFAGMILGLLAIGLLMYLFILSKILAFYGFIDLSFLGTILPANSDIIANITLLIALTNLLCFFVIWIVFNICLHTSEQWEDIVMELSAFDDSKDYNFGRGLLILFGSLLLCLSSFWISAIIPLIINH